MSMSINTNVQSLTAQHASAKVQNSLSTAMARLSSGLRINSAKDDAAGLAISNRFTTQINGLNQAARNANDGISLAQTGEGALNEVSNNLQRIRELAVQAANATNSTADRAAIDLEVQQRLHEIDRTASQTSFNGQKLLDGSFGSATFQIGANAGETISVGLSANLRLAGTGQIASTTSAVLGSSATGGSITATAGTLNFGTAGAAAVDGSVTATAATRLFGTAGTAGTGGTKSITSATTAYGTAATTQVDGTNVQGPITVFNFSGGNLAQFDVGGQSVTLNSNTTNEAGLISAIQSQLTGIAVTGDGAGNLTFTNTGSTTALAVTSADANAVTAGFANSAGTAGSAATAGNNATFTVDGAAVTLNQNYASTAAVATAIQSQLTGYTVNYSGGAFTITNNTAGSAAVTIAAPNAAASAAGFTAGAGTAGSAAVSSTNASFTADGQAISLTTDYASFDAMAADIDTQMGAGYTVTNANGAIKISKDGSTTAVAITGANANATAAGFGNTAGTAGSALVATTNASFVVDGTTVNLNANYASNAALATAIQGQLTGYTVTNPSGSSIQITNNTTGSAAVAITGADANAISAGFTNGLTGVAGTAGGSISLSNFSVNGTSLAGSYTSTQKLADAINSGVSGVYATVSSGALKLTSAADISLGGSEATGSLGYASATATASSGSLSTANTLTVDGALDTIQRVDNALSTVSTVRSTFGAIQNRFDSVIANLSSSAENLTSARSRIQDADFAAETAALSRSQVLQQAATAMVAQANQLPQQVLQLLRG